MASRGGGFAEGLQGGYRLGLARDQVEASRARDAREAERFGREKAGWEDEDLIKDFEANLFQQAPPDGATPDGLGDAKQDNLGTLNTAVQRGFKLLEDPRYARVRGKALDSLAQLGKKSQEMNDVLLQEARTRALPQMRTLYSPAATDEAKSQALTSMMTDLYPDGRNYQARVAGDTISIFDGSGQPIAGKDGKPRTMSMADVDTLVRDGLATPEAFFELRQNAINSRVEEAKTAEQRAYDERQKAADYRRTRGDTLSDRSYTEAQALQKEDREDTRDLRRSRREFISKSIAAFDKDAAAGMVDPSTREAYLKQLRSTADEQFSDGTGLPEPEPAQGVGTEVEVDIGDVETPIDRSRPILNNNDGTFSTERTITIETDGRWVNIPTIIGGRQVSEKEAVKAWRAGKNPAVGEAATVEAAERMARARSEQIGQTRGAEARTPPAVPVPEPEGLSDLAVPDDLQVARPADPIGAAISGLGDVGRRAQAAIPTRLEETQRSVQGLRKQLASGKPISHDVVISINQLNLLPDADLIAAGLQQSEVAVLRDLAKRVGQR